MERFFAPIPPDLWIRLIMACLIWWVLVCMIEAIRDAILIHKGLRPPRAPDVLPLPPDSEDDDDA